MQAPEPSPDRRKQNILLQALTRRTPAERAAFLDGACGEDSALRGEIEAHLAAEEANPRTAPLNVGAAGLRAEGGAAEATPTLLDETPLMEAPGTAIGHYKLLEVLGEGGFGTVWLAEQKEPVRRQVALKIIKLGMDTRQVAARSNGDVAIWSLPEIQQVLAGLGLVP
jgi:hypothetical protein